jgi:hypothetical protein
MRRKRVCFAGYGSTEYRENPRPPYCGITPRRFGTVLALVLFKLLEIRIYGKGDDGRR